MSASTASKRQRLLAKQQIVPTITVRVQVSDPTDAPVHAVQIRTLFMATSLANPENILQPAGDLVRAEEALQAHFRDVRLRAPRREDFALAGSDVAEAGVHAFLAACSLDADASSVQWWREQLAHPIWLEGGALTGVIDALLALQAQPITSVQERGNQAWA